MNAPGSAIILSLILLILSVAEASAQQTCASPGRFSVRDRKLICLCPDGTPAPETRSGRYECIPTQLKQETFVSYVSCPGYVETNLTTGVRICRCPGGAPAIQKAGAPQYSCPIATVPMPNVAFAPLPKAAPRSNASHRVASRRGERQRTNFGALLYLAMGALTCGIAITILALNHIRPPPPSEDAEVLRNIWQNLTAHHRPTLVIFSALLIGFLGWAVYSAFSAYSVWSIAFFVVIIACVVAWRKVSQEV